MVKAGGHYAIVFDWQKMPAYYPLSSGEKVCEAVADLSKYEDDYMGEQLRNVGLTYLYQLDKSDEMYARTCGVVTSREPAECFVSFDPNVSYLAEYIPYQVTGSKVRIDLDRDLMGVFPKDGDWNKRKQFFTASGITSSILEEAVLMELYRVPSLSTIQCLSKANDEGIPIYLVTPENIGSIDLSQIDEDARQEIECYVTSQGYEAIVPARNLQISDWTGVGYVLRDTTTHAGLYMISGGYGGGTFATTEDFVANFLEQFLSPSSSIWTNLEGGTMPALDAITGVYGLFDNPRLKLLAQSNMLGYMLSLGPLFMMSSRSAAMSGTSSLAGFEGTMEWVGAGFNALLKVDIVAFDFFRKNYYIPLGRRRVEGRVNILLGGPRKGAIVKFSKKGNGTLLPSQVISDDSGKVVTIFDGNGAVNPGDTITITAEVEGSIMGSSAVGLYGCDNSIVSIGNVLDEMAIFVYDTVTSKTEEDVSIPDKKFDYVQELLNQVVARKHTLLDKDNNEVQYNYLKEDGIYGQKSEEAIELLRSSFEPVSWDTSDVMKNLIRVYDNPPFNPEKWFTRVVDKDLLVGKRQYYSSSESDPNRHKDGLLELYDNFVVPFVDSIISRGEDFCENPTSDVSWLGRIGYDGLFVRPGGLKAAISILSVPGGGSSNDTLALSFDTTFVDSIVVDTVITDTVVNDTVYQDTTIDVDTLIIDTLLAVEIDTLDGVSCSERQTAVSYSWGSADSPERFRVRIRDQEGHDTLSNWIKYTYPFHQTGLNSKEYWIASYNLGWDRSRVNDADTQDYRIIGTEIKDPRDTTKLLYNPNYYNPNRWSGIDCNGFVQTCANYGYKYMATLIGEKYDTFNFVPRLHNEDSTAIDIWNVRGKRNIYTVFTNGTREIPANRRSIIKKGDVVRSSGHITLVYEADSEEPKSSILIQSDGVFTRKRNDTTFFARKVNRIWPLIEVFPSGSDLGRFYIWK